MFISFIACHAKGWLLVWGLISCIPTVHAEDVFYAHPDLHLCFTLNTDTKEAMLGRGDNTQHNALDYPPLGDEWWSNGTPNLWETLVIPESVTYAGDEYKVVGIHNYAFYKTIDVHKISLPESIRSIGDYAFSWCTYLEEINMSAGVTHIGSHAFELCFKIKDFNLPKTIISIGESAFSDCTGLKEIVIPASCINIADEAFTWCTNLSKIIIEDGTELLSLGRSYNLGLQYEGDGIYTNPVERGLFADCPIDTLYLGRNVKFPNSEKSPFGRMASTGSDSSGNIILTATGQNFNLLEFGDLVTELPDGIFSEASFDNELILPTNLKTIGNEAFYRAIEQYKIDLPASLEYIGSSALTGLNSDDGIRFVTCHNDRPFQNQGSFNNSVVVYVPSGSGALYRASEFWGGYKIVDDSDEFLTINVKTAGTLYSRLLAQDYQAADVLKLKLKGTLNEDDWNVVKEMTKLYDLDLSELNLSELPVEILKGKSSLVSIKFPSTLTSIPDELFNGSMYLTGTIEIPESCTSIGKNAFANTGIEQVVIPENVVINEGAFWNTGILSSVKLSGENMNVGYHSFALSGVESVVIGKGVKVEDEAFWYSKSLNSVTFEDGVESIGANVFDGCKLQKVTFNGLVEDYGNSPLKNVKEVHIADIATWCKQKFSSIEYSPLYYAEHLYVNGEEITELVIPESVNRIEDYSFYNRKNLQKLILSEGVKSIGKYAFYGCSNIEDLQISSSLKKIDDDAFNGCEKLSELDFPLSIDTIGIRAFQNCNNLTKIVVHWDNPFTISGSAFYGVSSDCYLYVPILTAAKYLNAGWNVPNMKEVGIISVAANIGGLVSYNEEIIKGSGQFLFPPYKSFTLDITPDEGYSVKKVKLNGENVTSLVENGKLLIEEPEENFTVSVVFADNRIVDGDVNGDGIVDKKDAVALMEHIVKKTPDIFYDYASDLDENDIINITDGVRIVNKSINEN